MLGLPPNARYCSPGELYQEFHQAWFKLAERFFKLERLQTYEERGNPSYEAFEQGNWEEALRLAKQQAQEADPLTDFALQHGIQMVRVHILEPPISDYLWWEFHTYVGSALRGERILVASSSEVKDIDEAYQLSDFLLFDRSVSFVHDYANDGVLRGAWKTTDSNFLQSCASAAEALVLRSEPFQAFCAHERPGWLDLWETGGVERLL